MRDLTIQDSIVTVDSIRKLPSSLKRLYLHKSGLGNTEVRVLAFTLCSRDNDRLTELSLSFNTGITDSSVTYLANLICTNYTITHLYLWSTSISSHGAVTLLDALETNQTLITLKIDRKHRPVCELCNHYNAVKHIISFV